MGFPRFPLPSRQEVPEFRFADATRGHRSAFRKRSRGGCAGKDTWKASVVSGPTSSIGADGRHAITHTKAGFELREFGVPIDVLWMRISKRENDPPQSLGFFRHGKLLMLLDRGNYFQVGFVIPKGSLEGLKQHTALATLHRDIVALGPFLEDRITELDDWSKIKLLTVQINRLRKWCREGLTLYRRQRARHVARGRRRHQPRIAGRGRDREFTSGKIKSRTGIGGRLGAGAEASRMADTLDSGGCRRSFIAGW